MFEILQFIVGIAIAISFIAGGIYSVRYAIKEGGSMKPQNQTPKGSNYNGEPIVPPVTSLNNQTQSQSGNQTNASAGFTQSVNSTNGESQKLFKLNILFAALLGGWGADRFYIGKIGTGILKLVTAGGLGVWSLIDVILGGLGKTKDKQGLPLAGRKEGRTFGIIVMSVYIVLWILSMSVLVLVIMIISTSLIDRNKVNDIRNTYLLAAENDDIEIIKPYIPSDPNDISYVQSTLTKNDGNCQTIEASTIEVNEVTGDKRAFYLLDCPTSASRYWRLGMYQVKEQAWLLKEITNSNAPLMLMGQVVPQPQESTPVTSAPISSSQLRCLTPDDATYFGSYRPDDVFAFFVSDNVFFTADSTNYQYPNSISGKYAKFGQFASAASNAGYTIELVGATKEASVTNQGALLANQRAEKVKTELIAVGVPSERIIIVNNPSYTQPDGDWARNVTIKIIADSNCQ